MKKSIFFLFIFLLLTSIVFAKPGSINYNKKGLQFGETVYFNQGDAFWPYERPIIDSNGYLYPEVFPYLEKAKFIHLETNDKREPTKVYLLLTDESTGENYVFIWKRITGVIPQQNVILLNW